MGRGAPKDIFVIHTKSNELDRRIVDALAEALLPMRFTMWGYSDWDWYESREERPTWQDDLMSQGYIDPERAFEDQPLRRRKQADGDRLDEIFSRTRAVIFLNPSDGFLTDGMKEELWSLRRRLYRRDQSMPKPVLLWCAFEDNDREPIPIEDTPWLANIRLEVQEGSPNEVSVAMITAALSALLLEQRLEYVRELTSEKDGTLSLLFCRPEDEIYRASQILELAQCVANKSPNESLAQHTDILGDFLRRYVAKDLDDRIPWGRETGSTSNV